MRLYRVYRLILAGATVYVGVTSQPLAIRLREHRHRLDLHLEIEQIDSLVATRAEAEQRERQWIYQYLVEGASLLNVVGIVGNCEQFAAFLRQHGGPSWEKQSV